MDTRPPIRVLLVDDNAEFAGLLPMFLEKNEPEVFEVVWSDGGPAALETLEKDQAFDVILMDYFLPGQNGVEVTKAIKERGITIPIVFLTVNKDFDLAVEVLKLGVEDYLVKDEVSTSALPRTILAVIERRRLRDELEDLEISKHRLEAIQEMVEKIMADIREPMEGMRKNVEALIGLHPADNLGTYLTIIRDNLVRIERKIVQLKELKSDRTVPYIRDIRMIDLSE